MDEKKKLNFQNLKKVYKSDLEDETEMTRKRCNSNLEENTEISSKFLNYI